MTAVPLTKEVIADVLAVAREFVKEEIVAIPTLSVNLEGEEGSDAIAVEGVLSTKNNGDFSFVIDDEKSWSHRPVGQAVAEPVST